MKSFHPNEIIYIYSVCVCVCVYHLDYLIFFIYKYEHFLMCVQWPTSLRIGYLKEKCDGQICL